MARRADTRTLDLFELPTPTPTTAGSLACGSRVRALLSEAVKQSPLSRFEVAARMSELLGVEISKHQLDAWTAESRDAWRFPFEYAAAFEAATETYALTEYLASVRGCTVLVGEDALLAEMGRLERQEQRLKERRAALRDRLRSITR